MALQETSFNLCQLHDRVLGDIGMRGSNLISEADVSAWAREILRRAAQETHWYRTTATESLVEDQAEYDLPAGWLSLESVLHDQLPIEAVAFADLMHFDAYWQQTTGTLPLCYYLRGAGAFGIYPTPSADDDDSLTLFGAAIPAFPATPTDPFSFPTANEQLIVSYCLHRAALKDMSGEGQRRVPVYQQEYMAELQRFRETVSGWHEGELLVMGKHSHPQRWPDAIERATVPSPY